VFCEGAVAGVLTGNQITEAEILRLAAGVRQNQKAA
jgi:hypothetical protein